MRKEQLNQLLADLTKVRVGVVGDFCLDIYWEVLQNESQISVETLKMIQQVSSQKCALGGAGNIAMNLKKMGVNNVHLFGIIGNDLYGREMYQLMKASGLITNGIFTQNENWLTNVYIKPIVNQMEQNRYDLGSHNIAQEMILGLLLNEIESSLSELDIVIINQQLIFGIHTEVFRKKINILIQSSKIPFIVDSRNFSCDFNSSIRKMNEFELFSIFNPNLKPHDEIYEDELKVACLKLFELTNSQLIVTRGNKKSYVVNHNCITEVPNQNVIGPIDTVGAGDSFLAGFASVFGCIHNPVLAVEMGHKVAAITIKKIGETGFATPSEILENHQEMI